MRCLAFLKVVILVILVVIVRINCFDLRDYFLQSGAISISSRFNVGDRRLRGFGFLNRVQTIAPISTDLIEPVNNVLFTRRTFLYISQPGRITAIAADHAAGIVINALLYVEISL